MCLGTAAINRWNQGILLEAQAAMCRCRYCSMDNSDLLELWVLLVPHAPGLSLGRAYTELQPEGSAATRVCGSRWVLAGHWILYIPWSTPCTDPRVAGLCWLILERALSLPREFTLNVSWELLSSRKYRFVTGNRSVSLLLIKMCERSS